MPIMHSAFGLSLPCAAYIGGRGGGRGGKLLGRWEGGETQEGFDDGKSVTATVSIFVCILFAVVASGTFRSLDC